MLKRAPEVILSEFLEACGEADRLVAEFNALAERASKAKAAAGRAKQRRHFASLHLNAAMQRLRQRLADDPNSEHRAYWSEMLAKCEELVKNESGA